MIHYFITRLKTKIDVIPRGCFKFQAWEPLLTGPVIGGCFQSLVIAWEQSGENSDLDQKTGAPETRTASQ